MKTRGFVPVFLFMVAFSAAARSAGDEVRSFGAETGPFAAIIAETATISELEAFFLENPPSVRITLVPRQAENAFLGTIPADTAAAIILTPAEDGVTTVYPGSRGKTTSAWLLAAVRSALDESGVEWKLERTRMTLYRLGWTAGNERLSPWLDAGIPAIAIASAGLAAEPIASIAAAAASSSRTDTDSHFLVVPLSGSYRILSETTMVALMIAASAVILFFLFVFSFLFGKKSDQRLRDFFRVWWLPFIYFAVNFLSLAIAQRAISSLVEFRLGNAGAWALMPVQAFAAKVGVSWFVGALVFSLNQLVKFPEDGFIYGYIASIVSLLNVFAFASLDFSLSVLFLSAYLLSIGVARLTRPFAQAIGIAILSVPFLPYCAALFAGDARDVSAYLAPLYFGEGFWNGRLALVAMPFQLFGARLAHELGIFGKRTKWYLPVSAFVALAACLAAVAILSLTPPYSRSRPVVATVTERIDGAESRVSVATPVDIPGLTLGRNPEKATNPSLERDGGRIVPVTATSKPFLDRRLVTIAVRPAIPYDRAEIAITGDGFISVLDSSEPFELRDAGTASFFSHEPSPDDADNGAWTVSFSAPSDETVTASIRLVSSENPWGVTADAEGVRTDYRLEVVSTVDVYGKAP